MTPIVVRRPAAGLVRVAAASLAAVLVLAGCSSGSGRAEAPESPSESSSASSPDQSADESPSESPSESPATPAERPTQQPTEEPTEPPHPVSMAALSAGEHTGDRLRLGAVRERTAAYTSYDVTYRATTTDDRGTRRFTISGVLNVPTGRGPFPAVVLAHGYIDPDYYVRGQGMTRERGFLADRGFVALHVTTSERR